MRAMSSESNEMAKAKAKETREKSRAARLKFGLENPCQYCGAPSSILNNGQGLVVRPGFYPVKKETSFLYCAKHYERALADSNELKRGPKDQRCLGCGEYRGTLDRWFCEWCVTALRRLNVAPKHSWVATKTKPATAEHSKPLVLECECRKCGLVKRRDIQQRWEYPSDWRRRKQLQESNGGGHSTSSPFRAPPCSLTEAKAFALAQSANLKRPVAP